LYSEVLELPKREFDGRETRWRWWVHPFFVGRRKLVDVVSYG
jgi:hypothetical protein